jgi:hypothetical protein
MTDEDHKDAIDLGQQQTVLVRVIEWTEWIPGKKDENAEIVLSDGITGFVSGKNERLLEVAVSGTGVNRRVTVEGENGTEDTILHYGLYAFQAVLAQNVQEDALTNALALQRPMDLPKVQTKESGLVVTQNMPQAMPKPPNNRQQRRHPQ